MSDDETLYLPEGFGEEFLGTITRVEVKLDGWNEDLEELDMTVAITMSTGSVKVKKVSVELGDVIRVD